MSADVGFDWAVASRPLPGEDVSGDAALVLRRGERTILAAIDGLGHGPEAAAAADCAQQILADNAAEPLEPLLLLCHQALARTRGVVATIVAVDHGLATMEWLAVGNVEAALVRAPPREGPGPPAGARTVFHFPGILGYRFPVLHIPVEPIAAGDLLVMATDGIAHGFLDDLAPGRNVEQLAHQILDRYARPVDDALVVVARYLGPGADWEPPPR